MSTFEVGLYSDTWFIGEERGIGPYSFINTIAHASQGEQIDHPVVIMRCDTYGGLDLPNMSRTIDEHYHGGNLFDELASLCSLAMGARLMAGPVTREFRAAYDDPKGRPMAYGDRRIPRLPVSSRKTQIPYLKEQKKLEDVRLLDSIPHISAEDYRGLVKSARLYQQAVWYSDSDPNICWLFLVSAIESAASRFDEIGVSGIERLRSSLPKLYNIIVEKSDPEFLERVAGSLSKLIGSTAKFTGFIGKFNPGPPRERPLPEWQQVSFESAPMLDAMKKIYSYRSRALHGGIAFPAPMCMPPIIYAGEGFSGAEEKPMGLASSSEGATWLIEDTPMLLHTFEWIVRGALLNWWRALDLENGSVKVGVA